MTLAENFVDGVLSVFTLKADRVETKELCVEGVCVNASELQELLERQNPEAVVEVHEAPPAEGDNGGGDEPTEPAPVEPEAPGAEEDEIPVEPPVDPTLPGGDEEVVPPTEPAGGTGEVSGTPREPTPEPEVITEVVPEPTPETPPAPESEPEAGGEVGPGSETAE